MDHGDVNIPQQLLDAAAKDEVVFFVGAGVSFNPPSNLPSYEQLATKLAEEADEPLPHNGEQLDVLFGMRLIILMLTSELKISCVVMIFIAIPRTKLSSDSLVS